MPKHFLLVDDDADDIELFGEALGEANALATYQYFDDAAGLIAATTNNSVQKPDVIFLDINMSTVSGWDCLHFIKTREMFLNVPVIMYSTSSHKKEMELALNEGAIGFVTKPSNFQQLIDILKKILASNSSELKQVLSQA